MVVVSQVVIVEQPPKHQQTMIKIVKLSKKLRQFQELCGYLPTEKDGIELLNRNLTDCPRWVPIENSEVQDAWKQSLNYRLKNQDNFILFSYGEDGALGGAGSSSDISSENL